MDSLYVRYANALLSLAKDEGKIKEYKEAIKSLLEFFESNNEVNTYLKSYFVTEEDKYQLIDKISDPFKLKSLSSFIKLLVKKHRFVSFKYIAEEFISDCNDDLGIQEGYIYSTIPLDAKQIKAIEEGVSSRLNQKVELINKIDERLIGGVKVIVHDHVFDGSIKNKLETMKQKLNERRS